MAEPRELRPSEIVDVAERLARATSAAGVSPGVVAGAVGLELANLDQSGAPRTVWYRIVQMVHAGASAEAGYRSDAVARLIENVGSHVPADQELRDWAYRLGQGLDDHVGERSVFLSYAHPDRAAVDRLHDALRQLDPGVKVFQDHRSLVPGQDWLAVLRQNAGTSSVLACWVTSAFLKSSFCNYEVGVADSRGAAVVPIFTEPSITRKVPAYLSRPQGLGAATPPDFVQLAEQIIAAL